MSECYLWTWSQMYILYSTEASRAGAACITVCLDQGPPHQQALELEGEYHHYWCLTGTPQGCVLSPVVFNMLTRNCTIIHSTNTIGKFADNATVVDQLLNNKTRKTDHAPTSASWASTAVATWPSHWTPPTYLLWYAFMAYLSRHHPPWI